MAGSDGRGHRGRDRLRFLHAQRALDCEPVASRTLPSANHLDRRQDECEHQYHDHADQFQDIFKLHDLHDTSPYRG